MSVNSRLKATQVIGQREAFYRQRIPESSCVTSTNGDRHDVWFLRYGVH